MRSSDAGDVGVLQIFILTLVDVAGVDTLYRLRREVGLEPGGIKSALQTLERNSFIQRGAPGRRGRKTFIVTSQGRQALRERWALCLTDQSSAEAVLRAAMIAWWMCAPGMAADYLEKTVSLRQAQAKKLHLEAEHLERSQSDPLSAYGWMRVLSEAHRRRAEADALLSISQSIQERSKKDVQQP
jgi:DNA-binding PadR family transcriptional regulator